MNFGWSFNEIGGWLSSLAPTPVDMGVRRLSSTESWAMSECTHLGEKVADLELRIEKLRRFFEERPGLFHLAKERLKDDDPFISRSTPLDLGPIEEGDWIGKRGMLLIKVNTLQHTLEEQTAFIHRHTDLFLLFSEAVKQKLESTTLALEYKIPTVIVTNENGVMIE